MELTKTHRLFISLAGIVVASLTLSGATLALDKNGNFVSKQERDEHVAATLKKMTREMNSQAPIQLDEETRMMSVIALQKTVTFNMRLTRFKYSQVDPSRIAQAARTNLNHIVCQSKATRELIDMGVEYVYLYNSSDAIFITRVVINSYRC